MRYHAPVDATGRDYLVWERDGEEPLAALATSVAMMLRFIALRLDPQKSEGPVGRSRTSAWHIGCYYRLLVVKLWVVCVLTLVLTFASASVWAQPATAPTSQATEASPAIVAATDQARVAVTSAGQRVNQIAAQRGRLQQHYADQLAAVDRLKNERASWRRDRELNANQADSNDTAKQLDTLTKQLAAAADALVRAQRALATTVDAELAAGATGARAGQLARWRAELDTALGAKPKKIVMPEDVKIDQLDPEDLEQQAQIIADTEKQLAAQVAGLDQQAAALAQLADSARATIARTT